MDFCVFWKDSAEERAGAWRDLVLVTHRVASGERWDAVEPEIARLLNPSHWNAYYYGKYGSVPQLILRYVLMHSPLPRGEARAITRVIASFADSNLPILAELRAALSTRLVDGLGEAAVRDASSILDEVVVLDQILAESTTEVAVYRANALLSNLERGERRLRSYGAWGLIDESRVQAAVRVLTERVHSGETPAQRLNSPHQRVVFDTLSALQESQTISRDPALAASVLGLPLRFEPERRGSFVMQRAVLQAAEAEVQRLEGRHGWYTSPQAYAMLRTPWPEFRAALAARMERTLPRGGRRIDPRGIPFLIALAEAGSLDFGWLAEESPAAQMLRRYLRHPAVQSLIGRFTERRIEMAAFSPETTRQLVQRLVADRVFTDPAASLVMRLELAHPQDGAVQASVATYRQELNRANPADCVMRTLVSEAVGSGL